MASHEVKGSFCKKSAKKNKHLIDCQLCCGLCSCFVLLFLILAIYCNFMYVLVLRTPREEIAFTARPKIQSQSQIVRYGRSIFCLPHWPNFSNIFDLCLHWVSVVRESVYCPTQMICKVCCSNFPLVFLVAAVIF